MATSIRLDTETGQRLDFLAAWTGRPKALLLRELIKRGRLRMWKSIIWPWSGWNVSDTTGKKHTPLRT